MANYDSGVTYDSGILYDQPAPPASTRRTRMAKAKSGLKDLSDPQTIQMCINYKTALTGNATFTTPTPPLASFNTMITNAQAALTAADNMQTAAKAATSTKDTAMATLKAGAAQLVNYVNLIAAGDEAKILSAGMGTAAAASPSVVPAQVMNLAITSGDNSGELDLQWDPVGGIKSYDVQLSPDPITATSWQTVNSVTKSKAVQLGLTSGARMWVRVRGVGPGGQGPWSDPATKIVP